MSKFNRFNVLASALFVVMSLPAFAAKSDSKVIFMNKSSWAIHEMYFSPTKSDDWGDDQLGKKTISTNEEFTLTGVPCGKWDVKVVDEDGDECTVEGVDLCGETDKWVIKDSDLLACQADSQ